MATFTPATIGAAGRGAIPGLGAVAADGTAMGAGVSKTGGLATALAEIAARSSPTIVFTFLSATSTVPFAASIALFSGTEGFATGAIFCRAATKAAATLRVAAVLVAVVLVGVVLAATGFTSDAAGFALVAATTLARAVSGALVFVGVLRPDALGAGALELVVEPDVLELDVLELDVLVTGALVKGVFERVVSGAEVLEADLETEGLAVGAFTVEVLRGGAAVVLAAAFIGA